MNRDTDWALYEERKAEIRKQNLSPEEYERAIRELACDLEV